MENNKKISSNQFMCILFLSAMLLPFAASRAMFLNYSGINISFSVILCAGLLMILMKPTIISHKAITESRYLSLAYLFYFLYMGIYNLSLFLVFVSNVISPKISTFYLAIGICIVAVYGSFKGIETIARSSAVIIFVTVSAILVLIFASAFEIKGENIKIQEFSLIQVFGSSFSFFSRTCILPTLIFLLKSTDEKINKSFKNFIIAAFSMLFFLVFFSVGALGSYFNTQLFPIYRLSEIVSVGPFTKGEIFFLGVFLLGLIMQISAIIYVSYKCVFNFSKSEKSKEFYLFFGALIIAFSVLVSSSVSLQHYVFSKEVLLILALIFAIGIPIYFSFLSKPRNKKIISVLLIMLLFLPGCSEAKIQDKMLVSGIYIDKTKEEYNIGLIASHSENSEYYEGKGESIKESIDIIENQIGKKSVFSHDMIILIGENIAKNNIRDTLDFFLRYYEIIPSSKLIYCDLDSDTLKGNVSSITKEAAVLIKNKNIKKTDIVNFTNSFIDNKGEFALPILEKKDESYSMSRIAFFKDESLYAFFDENMAKDYLLVLDEIKEMTVLINDDILGKATLSLRNIKVKNTEDIISVSCDADICEYENDKIMGYEEYKLFEEKLNAVLRKKIQAVFSNTACKIKNIIINSNVNRMEEKADPLF